MLRRPVELRGICKPSKMGIPVRSVMGKTRFAIEQKYCRQMHDTESGGLQPLTAQSFRACGSVALPNMRCAGAAPLRWRFSSDSCPLTFFSDSMWKSRLHSLVPELSTTSMHVSCHLPSLWASVKHKVLPDTVERPTHCKTTGFSKDFSLPVTRSFVIFCKIIRCLSSCWRCWEVEAFVIMSKWISHGRRTVVPCLTRLVEAISFKMEC